MYLTKLELQGFKTFAKKTTLTFSTPKKKRHALTAIVGPNGSGKSNLADAIRWALGEQSMKLLRGKQSEDVIFAGAIGKSRAGFAEITLTFDNSDQSMPIEFSEVAITRRLYRDGSSEYLVNNSKSRLADIQLLLAQANVGQRSYSVIGQGMVDHILIASPEERKAFFDDATGVKQFQIKRHQAVLRLKRTYENLEEIEMVLRELTPRLRSLKRQVKRLEQREEIEKELHEMQFTYYGSLWGNLKEDEAETKKSYEEADKKTKQARFGMKELENKLEKIAKAEVEDGTESELQKQYREVQRGRSKLRDEEFRLQKEIELAKVRAQSTWAPLPLPKIIDTVKSLAKEQAGLVLKLKKVKDLKDVKILAAVAHKIEKESSGLLKKLERPAPEDIKPDPKLVSELNTLRAKLTNAETELKKLEAEIDQAAKDSKKERTELFEIQKSLREKQSELYKLEQERNNHQISIARLEERRVNLSREIEEELKDKATELKNNVSRQPSTVSQDLYPQIQKLKYKLELIGGIDEETVAEFKETNERHEFLDEQMADLRKAIKDTEKIIDELDEKIAKQSAKLFKDINKEFQRYFKILFGGGSCSLVKMTADNSRHASQVTPERGLGETGEEVRQEVEEETLEEIGKRVKEKNDRVVGIDIQATPPGKKLKGLNLLSGGERALTSIALLSAIMATNPSPFVILDEVDAALDEANTVRFATILDELRKLTQFIVISHNRATMERSDIIYGITMGDDGISNVLSVSMEELKENHTSRG